MVRIQLDNSFNGEPMHTVTVMKTSVQIDTVLNGDAAPYVAPGVSLPQVVERDGPVSTMRDTQAMKAILVRADKEIMANDEHQAGRDGSGDGFELC